jgi:hypothetical protein
MATKKLLWRDDWDHSGIWTSVGGVTLRIIIYRNNANHYDIELVNTVIKKNIQADNIESIQDKAVLIACRCCVDILNELTADGI